jgi:hypothetical protein
VAIQVKNPFRDEPRSNFVWPNWLTYAFFHRARPTLAGALNAQGKNGGKWRFFEGQNRHFLCLEPEFLNVSH